MAQNNAGFSSMQALRYAQSKMSDVGIIMTCRNCEHCDMTENKCKLYNAQPPISVVTTGCDQWEIMIPF